MALEGQRKTYKTSILKITKFSNSITEGTDIFDLQTHNNWLMDVWKKYEDVHFKIIEKTGEENLDFQKIEYDDTETIVLQTQSILTREIDARTPEVNVIQQAHQHNQNDQGQFAGLRVPRVAVPEFSGDYLEWPSFRDLFVSLVGQNPKIPNVQKLSYLKKVVKIDSQYKNYK